MDCCQPIGEPIMPHVLVLYNAPTLPPDHPAAAAERDVLKTVDAVAGTLAAAGHRVSRLGISDDPATLVHFLGEQRPDVVFNLFEGTGARNQTEAYCAGLLEWARVPYTGCPMAAAVLARDKPLTKKLFRGAGLPTANFFVVDSLPLTELPQRWPVMVKLTSEDASIGIDQGSIVHTPEALTARVRYLLDHFHPPVLVEDYLDGREFNIAVIGDERPRALPVSEIIFDPAAADLLPIVTYASKWAAGSREDLAQQPRCPADIPPALARRLEELALAAFRLLGCRDYARIDFRTDRIDRPFLLEVNPNPDFGPTAGLAKGLHAAGMTHEQFTLDLVRRALERGA
jgi:D-alanine-D-alanine ligase